MYIDAQNLLSSSQAVTASAASTNYIDLGIARDVGGGMLQLVVTCNTAATASGAATVQFQLQTATDAAFTTPVIVEQTDAIPKASLVAGYQFFMPIPLGSQNEYMRLYYNVGTGPLTAGAFSAAVVMGAQKATVYASPTQY